MKKILLPLGVMAATVTPIISVVACDTEKIDRGVVFDLKTLQGVEELYETFINPDTTTSVVEGIYSFKVNDSYLTNEWTAAEINAVRDAGTDEGFDLTGMGLQDATDVLEDAFNNMPRMEDWDTFISDATDGILNKYLYYAADETNADPNNKDGEWGDYNIKGHDIYDKSKALIEDAFGTLPANIDLYHVERGGDSAKNLYFKLIDRNTDEILEDQFKIDIKWNATQEDVDSFGNSFFSKLIGYGKELFASTKALYDEIVAKNNYTDFKPFIKDGVEFTFSVVSDIVWYSAKPFLEPFSTIPGAKLIYSTLMDIPIGGGANVVMDYLDSKYETLYEI